MKQQTQQLPSQSDDSTPDGANVGKFVKKLRTIDINNYATRKSVAVGLLDLALLTSNAAQLKYLLAYGSTHEYYVLLYVLVVLSIALQVFQALLIIILAIIYDLNKLEEQRRADVINSVLVGLTVFTVVVNVILSVFEMREVPPNIK
uniref:CSON008877 protein n=1 Tax=Culicoides sonorensis TaxID=179676 RepID=A0A336KDX4_CULSO